MSKRKILVSPPVGRDKFPNVKHTEKEDFFFCAFYPSSGFTDRGAKKLLSRTIFNSVISGNKSIVLKWLDAENDLEFAKPESEEATRSINSLLRRSFNIGSNFKGRITSSDNTTTFSSKSTGFRSTEGNPIAFQEQAVQTRITIITDTDFFMQSGSITEVDQNKLRYFFVAPELAGNDVLYIESSKLFFDEHEQKNHMEIDLVSLGDQLRSVGRSIENLITFGEPGAGFFPFPDVYYEKVQSEESAAEDLGLFYNLDDEEIEYNFDKKQLYLKSNPSSYAHNLTQAAHSWQIEFDGIAFLNSVVFYGRPTPQDLTLASGEVIPSWQLVSKIRPIFTSRITQPRDEFLNSQYERNFYSITGKIMNESWFTDWREEYGYFFDPNKQRNSEPVFNVQTTGTGESTFFQGRDFSINEDEQKTTARISGVYNLATSIWSNFVLNAEVAVGGGMPFTPKDDWVERSIDFASFLNTQAIITHGVSYLEHGGARTRNNKGLWSSGVDGALQVVGTIAAGIAGGVSGGIAAIAVGAIAGLTKQAKDTIFRFIPDRFFSRQDVYRPTSCVDFLVPKNFLEDIIAKKSDYVNNRYRIPLELLNNQESNYLSGFINSKNYKCGFAGDLTHKFKLSDSADGTRMDSIKFFDGSDSVNIRTQAIDGLAPLTEERTGYAIDAMSVHALTKVPYKLTFYNAQGVPIWTTTKFTQSGYTGRLQEWETFDFLSDLKESAAVESNEEYRFEPYPEREILPINDRNKTAIQEATARLQALNSVQLIPSKTWIFSDLYPSAVSSPGNSRTRRFKLQALNTDFRDLSSMTFPADVKADLILVHSSVNPTDHDLMKLLKDNYGFTKIETSTYNEVTGNIFFPNLKEYINEREAGSRVIESFIFSDRSLTNSIVDIPDNTEAIIDDSKRYYPYDTTTIDSKSISIDVVYARRPNVRLPFVRRNITVIIYWGYISAGRWELKYSFTNSGQIQISERNKYTDIGHMQFRVTKDDVSEWDGSFQDNETPSLSNINYRNAINTVFLTKS